MGKRKKIKAITAAGRRRVERALERHGMLLVQGQAELPSVADLLEGKPITTRGYSWDYVPAWRHSWDLAQRKDVTQAKLFRGRRTLILKKLWPAVDTLAQASFRNVLAGNHGAEDRLAMLELVQAEPGITGDAIKDQLGWSSRDFQRAKNDLDRWLCLWGEDREEEEDEGHTHDRTWFTWSHGELARALRRRKRRPKLDQAVALLLEAVYPDGSPEGSPRSSTLFPVLEPASAD